MDLNSWASLPIRFNSQNSNNKDESTAQTARSMFPNKFKEWDEVISRFIWSGKKHCNFPKTKGKWLYLISESIFMQLNSGPWLAGVDLMMMMSHGGKKC